MYFPFSNRQQIFNYKGGEFQKKIPYLVNILFKSSKRNIRLTNKLKYSHTLSRKYFCTNTQYINILHFTND